MMKEMLIRGRGKKSLLFSLVFGVVLLTGCSPNTAKFSSETPLPTNDAAAAKKQLKLDTFDVTATTSAKRTSTPIATTPTNLCSHDSGQPVNGTCDCTGFRLACKDRKCQQAIDGRSGDLLSCEHPYGYETTGDQWCSIDLYAPTDGTFCVGKPVVYLYPTKPTFVDVSVETPGRITQSDPLYPLGGWKQVLAEPNGTLHYLGKTYKELFYETSVTDIVRPATAITIRKDALRPALTFLTYQLGLSSPEQVEFLDFWVPKLEALSTKYVSVSLVEPQEKDRIDHLSISPKPDTFITLLFYFRGTDIPDPNTLDLPSSPPVRKGFTAVEWGGTIAPVQ